MYIAAYLGVIPGRSVALPPQMMSTSISSLPVSRSAVLLTGTPGVLIFRVEGSRREYTAASVISSFFRMAASTPLPRLP